MKVVYRKYIDNTRYSDILEYPTVIKELGELNRDISTIARHDSDLVKMVEEGNFVYWAVKEIVGNKYTIIQNNSVEIALGESDLKWISVPNHIKEHGIEKWHQNGRLHREDGPAYICADGFQHWYQNGKRHRLDGPAMEFNNGGKAWFQNDIIHRENGPAMEGANGDKEWYQEWYRWGVLHREYGPAKEFSNGDKKWYYGDKLHRENGPAVEFADGQKAWYIEGKRLTEEEFHSRHKNCSECQKD